MEPTKAKSMNGSAGAMRVGVEPVAKRLMNGLTDTTGSGSTETGSGSMETKSTGAVSTDADIMNVSPMREFGVGSLGVTAQRSVFTIRAGLRLTDTTVFGLGSTGMRSVGTVLPSADRGLGAPSPGLGSAGTAHTNAGWTGMGSGCTDGVVGKLLGTGFANAMRTGSTVTSLGTGLTGVGVVELLGATGLRPRASSTSAAQSNCACSCSITSNAKRAVGDGAGSRTSPWVIPVHPCSPRSLAPSCFPTPFSSSSLPTPGSLSSFCLTVVMALFKSVAVVLVGFILDRAATGVGVAVTCRTSSARSDGSDVVVVSSVVGAVVLVYAGMVVVVGVLHVIGVAVSVFLVVTGFGISSNVFGEAPSHFTRKCKTRVDQEVTTAGEFCSRFSYQSSASKPDRQRR